MRVRLLTYRDDVKPIWTEGVRRVLGVLEPVENCALYAVGTVGDAMCAEVVDMMLKVVEVTLKVVEVMLKVAEVVMNAVEVLNGVRCVL